jgi:hypothetical protein
MVELSPSRFDPFLRRYFLRWCSLSLISDSPCYLVKQVADFDRDLDIAKKSAILAFRQLEGCGVGVQLTAQKLTSSTWRDYDLICS